MDEIKRGLPFFGSQETIDNADIVLMGIPYDCTASFRPGARFAPREIRGFASEGIEEFSFHFGKSIEEVSFYDAGDLPFMSGSPEAMVKDTWDMANCFLAQGKRLISLGGEHLVTYPLFLAYKKFHESFTIVHLDAHADLRRGYMGDSLSHASVMNLCLENGLSRLIQFGIRSGSRDEFEYRKNDRRIVAAKSIAEIDAALTSGEKIYFSIDVDFFDPGFFPGTGTPEPGGFCYNDFLAVCDILRKKKVQIIGADIVELAPQIDPTGNSTVFTAKLLRDLLMCMG